MTVIEEPEQPITDRTRAILESIDSKLAQLQNVSEAVKEIQRHLSASRQACLGRQAQAPHI